MPEENPRQSESESPLAKINEEKKNAEQGIASGAREALQGLKVEATAGIGKINVPLQQPKAPEGVSADTPGTFNMGTLAPTLPANPPAIYPGFIPGEGVSIPTGTTTGTSTDTPQTFNMGTLAPTLPANPPKAPQIFSTIDSNGGPSVTDVPAGAPVGTPANIPATFNMGGTLAPTLPANPPAVAPGFTPSTGGTF